jgi:very-short-patch-repair endonuclease
MSREELLRFPGYTFDGVRVYDFNGDALERFLVSTHGDIISVEDYSLDCLEEEWTPVSGTRFMINHRREVQDCENGYNGHVWVSLNERLYCICTLLDDIYDDNCVGDKRCCRDCGQLWKMYPEHQGKCWPCIFKSRLSGLANKCTRIHGLCKERRTCLNCCERSIANNEKSLWWSSRNNDTPYDAPSFSNEKRWINCPDCLHDREQYVYSITQGIGCRYCANKARCDEDDCDHCFNNSIASHPRGSCWHPSLNSRTARQVALNDDRDYWFICPDCSHDFKTSPNAVNFGYWCSYCHNKLRCNDSSCALCYHHSFASHPRRDYWHASKNPTTPRHIALNANLKYWFTCPDCENDFEALVSNVVQGQWCPYCKRKTERKLFEWLCSLPNIGELFKEASFDWCRNSKTGHRFRFDFYIPLLNLIIELDGIQHWVQVMNWPSASQTQNHDLFKMTCVNDRGIAVIRIRQLDVLYDKYDWKMAILPYIRLHSNPCRILLDNGSGAYTSIGYDSLRVTTLNV